MRKTVAVLGNALYATKPRHPYMVAFLKIWVAEPWMRQNVVGLWGSLKGYARTVFEKPLHHQRCLNPVGLNPTASCLESKTKVPGEYVAKVVRRNLPYKSMHL